MTITGYVPYFTIYSNAGTISLASEGFIAIPAPVIPPVEPPPGGGDGYAGGGGGVRRIRKFARRKREDEEKPELVGSTPVEVPALPPVLPPPEVPPAPGLMAGIPIPPITVLRSPASAREDGRLRPDVENDDDEAIALLLETLFS